MWFSWVSFLFGGFYVPFGVSSEVEAEEDYVHEYCCEGTDHDSEDHSEECGDHGC